MTSWPKSSPAFPSDRYDAGAFRRYVTFLRQPAPSPMVVDLPSPSEVVAVREREVMSVIPATVMPGPDLNGLMFRQLGLPVTTRYWHVAEELLALMA